MPVNATVGAIDANSYVTVAEADAYFSDSFGKGLWASALPADKDALVISASRSLDQFITWSGQKTSDTQSMEWPRNNAYDKTGRLYPNNVIPGPVRFAAFELAYYMLQNGGLSFAEQSVDRVKVGPVDVEFSEKSTDSGIPNFIEALVSHIGSSDVPTKTSVRMARLARV